LNTEIAKITEKKLLRKPVYYPLQTVARQEAGVEIEQQPEWALSESQIREELDGVNSFESLDSFDFQNDRAVDDKVEPVATIQPLVLVDNGKCLLTLEAQAAG